MAAAAQGPDPSASGHASRDSEAGPLHDDDERTGLLNSSASKWFNLRFIGPGLLVCLADTDAGCLIVAAQSGARWKYSLLLMQILLIPVLYLAQELTIRLGVHTKLGHTACIRKHYGVGWAWFAMILLLIECVCAMISEMSGVAAVAELWGVSRMWATLFSSALIVIIVISCNYRQIETIGVCLGLFELTFVLTMFMYHPNVGEVFKGMFEFHANPNYIGLVTANIGAVIMPWMIYFQQSAVVARRLETARDIQEERQQTLVGSCLTQLVMIGTLVTLAAANVTKQNLNGVKDIVYALSPVLGFNAARFLVSLAFIGGSLCAAFVVSLAASWALCEALGRSDQLSLDDPPGKAKLFYSSFAGVVCIGVVVLLCGVNVVKLNILVEVMDGILMPFAVGFLYLLATGEALPPELRVAGAHKATLAVLFSLCSTLAIVSCIYSIFVEKRHA